MNHDRSYLMLRNLQGMLDRVAQVLLAFSNVLLVALFLVINAEIVVRAAFGKSMLISDEYGGYLLCWLTLSSFLYGMRTDAFLKVEFLVNRLSGRRRALATAFAALGGLAVCAIVTYSTFLLVKTTWSFHTTSTHFSETPLYLPQSIMPVAFGLLSIAYLVQFIASLDEAVSPRSSAAAG